MRVKGGWVVEVDIKGFFTNLDHQHLRRILDLRIQDRSLRTFIDRWIKAGVLENDVVTAPESGTPQGGVVSPILSNVYLHEVLDKWFAETVQPRLDGEAFLVRYCDDFVVCERKQDAERIFRVLPKRFGKLTASGRLSKAVKKVDRWCKKNRHKRISEQHRCLCSMLRGHYNYYGIQCTMGPSGPCTRRLGEAGKNG